MYLGAESQIANETTAVRDQIQPIQIQASYLLANLFHFKHRAMEYFLDSDRFESVQLFIRQLEDNTILHDCSSPSSPSLWLQAFGNTQGMLSYLPCTTADVEALGSLVHPAIAAFKSGQELPPSPYLSKTLQPTSQPWQQLSHRTRQWTPGTSWSSASIKGSGSSTRSTVISSSLQDVHGAQAHGSKLQVSSWRESKGWEW